MHGQQGTLATNEASATVLMKPAPDLEILCQSPQYRDKMLEYSFPYLKIGEMATRSFSSFEAIEANRQAGNWKVNHPEAGGAVFDSRGGYTFTTPNGNVHSFIPDLSYINEVCTVASHLILRILGKD